MNLYRVLRDLWVRPGVVLTLDYVDRAGLDLLIEKGIIEEVEHTHIEEEVDDGD